MPKRLLLVLALTFLPYTASGAETPAGLGAEVPAGLGPETTTGTGSSTETSGTLQPAGQSPLQSTTQDSTGLTAPASALQAPVTTDAQLQVLAGEADGESIDPNEGADAGDAFWGWLVATLVLGFLIGAALILLRDRRRFRRNDEIIAAPIASEESNPETQTEDQDGESENETAPSNETADESPNEEPSAEEEPPIQRTSEHKPSKKKRRRNRR